MVKVTDDHLPVTTAGLNPLSQNLSCDEAFRLAYERLVVLPMCLLFITDTVFGGTPGFFLIVAI